MMSEGRWKAKCAGLMAALVWHVVIVAALVSDSRSGTLAFWEPNAPSADLRLPRSDITDVNIPLSTDSNQSAALVDHVALSNSEMHSLGLAEAESVNALRKVQELSVATASSPAAIGETPVRCEVHIHQAAHGEVQAIDFGECTGNKLWQRNLLEQLQQAARLVKPNERAILAPVRTLVVDSDAIAPEILAAQLMDPTSEPAKSGKPLDWN